MKSFLFSAIVLPLAITLGSSAMAQQQNHDHDHHHHLAPHGGTLVVLGDEAAHLELVLDPAKGHLTGYVLDGEAQKAIRIKQPEIKLHAYERDLKSTVSISLKPVDNPLTGEKAGDTSQFEATAKELTGKKQFIVTLEKLTVRGIDFPRTASWFPEGNH